jgi:fatty acid desaturase
VVSGDADHAIIQIHREMASLHHDYAAERRQVSVLALLLPLTALLIAITAIAALWAVMAIALTCIALAALL